MLFVVWDTSSYPLEHESMVTTVLSREIWKRGSVLGARVMCPQNINGVMDDSRLEWSWLLYVMWVSIKRITNFDSWREIKIELTGLVNMWRVVCVIVVEYYEALLTYLKEKVV